MQYRNITCVSDDLNAICTADEKSKPIDRRPCNTLCGQWLVSHWSQNVNLLQEKKHSRLFLLFFSFILLKCSGSCQNASITRRVWCSSSICNEDEQPLASRQCIPTHCVEQSIYKEVTESTTHAQKTKATTKKTTKKILPTTKASKITKKRS